jgi:hypothetical protein
VDHHPLIGIRHAEENFIARAAPGDSADPNTEERMLLTCDLASEFFL